MSLKLIVPRYCQLPEPRVIPNENHLPHPTPSAASVHPVPVFSALKKIESLLVRAILKFASSMIASIAYSKIPTARRDSRRDRGNRVNERHVEAC